VQGEPGEKGEPGPPGPGLIPGAYLLWSGETPPAGYLPCNGAAVSRDTYRDLYSAIGTRYGAGDGSTTFNLPDCTGRFLQGASGDFPIGSYVEAGVPDIKGSITFRYGTVQAQDGAFRRIAAEKISSTNYSTQQIAQQVFFQASMSNDVYGKSQTVQPPALTALICIKY
jgi:microcystin-dependent protein